MSYISLPIETNAGQLEQDAYELIQSHFPDWEPADAELAVWIVKWKSLFGSDLAELIVDVADEVFYRFGTEVHNVTPIAAAPATTTSTWTLNDTAGHTIEAGTKVGMRDDAGNLIAFSVISEVVVLAGADETAPGGVALQAIEDGEGGNGLTAPVELIDAIDYVDPAGIVLVAPTANGVDAETPTEYLDRLKEELSLLSRLVILPGDAEIVSRRIAGIQRALALDLYAPTADYRPPGNPVGNGLFDNEKTITIAVVDEDGAPLSDGVKDAVAAELALRREVNFVFYVIDPTDNPIDVTAEITVLSGYDEATVIAAAEDAITEYLAPASWGIPYGGAATDWENQGTVYRNELIALIDRVAGVDHVVDVELAADGDPLGTANLVLDGPAALTSASTIAVTT